jgi:hypothetical protein
MCHQNDNTHSYEFGHTFHVVLKYDKMFNKPTSKAGLFNKSSCLAVALHVIKPLTIIFMNLVALFLSNKMFKKPMSEANVLNKSSGLAAAIHVTKALTIIVMN